jgi:FkbM family methyltransferase
LTPFTLFDSSRRVLTEDDLLEELIGRRLACAVETLCFVGAHRYQERALIDRVFPRLRNIYLFEPLPDLWGILKDVARADRRIRLFPYALCDTDGRAAFNVTSNDAASSSLLPLGTHKALFPHVTVSRVLEVETRTLDSVIAEFRLELPDVLMLDVQGAEYRVLAALSQRMLQSLRMIYTEASKEYVYKNSRTLDELETLLNPAFCLAAFAPLTNETPNHGNALFIRNRDIRLARQLSATARLKKLMQPIRRLVGGGA